MQTKNEAQKIIANLVDRFDDQKDLYRKAEYNETLTRRDFIDPFFEALGWDVANKQGYAESYREVIHEDKIKVRENGGEKTKAPDYSFRLGGGKRLFFVEAKKPSVYIKDEILPAYQVRRYGWSAKMPISVITDFEEFAIYDCSKKPSPTDKASIARIKYLTYDNYLNEFDFIWNTFSKERVLKGSFDTFVKSDTHKKGTATVDSEFLQSLDRWRTYLAESIAKNNKHLDEDEINFAVQQTIDRIIFLRIAEDRSVEPYGNLKDCIANGNLYQNLYHTFVKADEKYNSGLFDFNKDKISHKLEIDNKVIKTIVNELYYPESPYEFAVLPVEILGTAYEQFLGKTISLSKSGKAVIEQKPEVRKAGGVYYTPQYIVDYIVKNTVGKLVENKTPKEIAKLKIADPACGSGSFLIGAYNYLLEWHLSFYAKNEDLAKKDKALTPTGELTTSLKKQILLNNIYGVDIDVNAVEVTKLSLLLKCMEGETQASIATQMSLFHERILPTLDGNIKSGNSLIDLDYYDNELDFGEEKKVKPFSWQKAFPEVFKQGGFDCVIGNPPYLSTKRGFAEVPEMNQYLKKKYITAIGQFDAYGVFIERALELIHDNGEWGFIIPKPILTNENMSVLRNLILNKGAILNIGDFGTPFEDASVEAVVICHSKKPARNNEIEIAIYKNGSIQISKLEQSIFLKTPNNSFTLKTNSGQEALLRKIEKHKTPFKDIVSVFMRGIEAGKKDNSIKPSKKNKNCKQLLRGQDVGRYKVNYQDIYVEVDFSDTKKFKSKDVYETQKKLLIRRVGSDLQATIDFSSHWTLNTIYNIQLKHNDYEFVLGVFNSSLISYWFKNRFVFEDKLFPYARVSQLETIPFPVNPKRELHDEIIKLVEQLLQLNKEKHETKLESKIEQLQNRIDYCEQKINELVYYLYGLTEEEIKIVEA